MDRAAALARREGRAPVVSTADVVEAFQQHIFGPPLSRPADETEMLRIGYHELVGHALIGTACGVSPFIISFKPRGGSFGRVYFPPQNENTAQTKQELLSWILIDVAGQMAEEKRFGSLGTSTGNAADLDVVRDACRALLSSGLVGDDIATSVRRSRGQSSPPPLTFVQEATVNTLIRRAKDAVRAIFAQLDQDRWEARVRTIMQQSGELVGDEAAAFMAEAISEEGDFVEHAKRVIEDYLNDPLGTGRGV
jgi:hypothetical protein